MLRGTTTLIAQLGDPIGPARSPMIYNPYLNADDPLPFDATRLSPQTFVGEVVMKQEMTAFLRAAQARGCRFQVGTDMLFEQIPAYLEFFGFGTATAEELRAVAKVAD